MTRATEALLTLFATSAVYFSIYAGIIPSSEKFHEQILPFLPWWVLVTFGAYSLGALGWDVLTFKDKKEKYVELLEQIDEAKAFYEKEGIDLD